MNALTLLDETSLASVAAARLLSRHAAVEEALRSGRLCLSAVAQLARVLTPGNESEVLPRFLGLSTREAKEVVAAILPCPAPPRREVVTAVAHQASVPLALAPARASTQPLELTPSSEMVRAEAEPLRTCEVPARAQVPVPPARVEPLTADLRRLHLTVSARLLEKIAKAKAGSPMHCHARPPSRCWRRRWTRSWRSRPGGRRS